TAARAGRFDEAHRWFEEARAELVAIGAEGEALLADAYAAECLVYQHRPVDALHRVADVVARADRHDSHVLDPLLRRIEGFAAAQVGDLEGARRALDASAIVATALGFDHELAFTLDALVRLHDDPKARARRDEIFEQLGIRAAPPAPLDPVASV